MQVDSSAPSEIEVQGISKNFGSLQVLKGVSLEIKKGEALALIGPSGSGKTTLLRCLNFLEDYHEGFVRLSGNPIGYSLTDDGRRVRQSDLEIAKMRSQLGMVFQSFNLFPHMSVIKNLMVAPIRILGVPAEEARETGMSLLDRVGLKNRAEYFPSQLSGGQQQRVAVARALAMKPRAMLFDEVTSALDPELVAEVLDVIRELINDGMTMAIVTHEMSFARSFSHRVAFMSEGELLELDTPQEIFENPKSARLQTFLQRFKDAYRF